MLFRSRPRVTFILRPRGESLRESGDIGMRSLTSMWDKLLEVRLERDETYKYPIFSFKPYSKLLPSPSTAPHVVDTGAMSCCFGCCSYRPGLFIHSTLEDAPSKHMPMHKPQILSLTACAAQLHPHHRRISYPGTLVDCSAQFPA